jgi:hypothetical protein
MSSSNAISIHQQLEQSNLNQDGKGWKAISHCDDHCGSGDGRGWEGGWGVGAINTDAVQYLPIYQTILQMQPFGLFEVHPTG